MTLLGNFALWAALLFGIRLPLNFASPYKACSIIEFWRRWHMTLSRFLRDYLYIPLGGNRRGRTLRYVNLLVTMLLGGLWHGAGWTFVIWGALHGIYLCFNHAWRAVCNVIGWARPEPSRAGRIAGGTLTFLAVVVGWVVFRSDDLSSALSLLKAMAGANGLGMFDAASGEIQAWPLIASLLAVVFFAPNTQEITDYVPPFGRATRRHADLAFALRWRPTVGWAMLCGGFFAASLLSLSKVSEFLYFQF